MFNFITAKIGKRFLLPGGRTQFDPLMEEVKDGGARSLSVLKIHRKRDKGRAPPAPGGGGGSGQPLVDLEYWSRPWVDSNSIRIARYR